jgi:hypothetical protein
MCLYTRDNGWKRVFVNIMHVWRRISLNAHCVIIIRFNGISCSEISFFCSSDYLNTKTFYIDLTVNYFIVFRTYDLTKKM